MKLIKISFTLLLIICSRFELFCQRDSNYHFIAHAFINHPLDNFQLQDSSLGITYLIDSTQIYVTAVDGKGSQIWRVDPWKDNGLPKYRTNRPKIVNFQFANNSWTNNKKVIWIIYNNTQFGILNRKTGRFTWLGQM